MQVGLTGFRSRRDRSPWLTSAALMTLSALALPQGTGVVVTDGPAPLPVEEDFPDTTTGEIPGIHDGNGVSFAQDCLGQTTIELMTGFEVTQGAPSVPLTLAVPPSVDGLFALAFTQTSRITGLANGTGNEDIGEGAVAILYDDPQPVVGLEISGGLAATVSFQCYDETGSLIGVATVPNQPFRELTITSLGEPIRLINFTHDATYGVSFGKLRHYLPHSEAFCAGDGAGASCPCGNSGQAGHGCANGSSPPGALLVAPTNDSLLVSFATPNQPVLFFEGTHKLGGGNGILFGDGLRCVGGAVLRLRVKTADATGSVLLISIATNDGGDAPGLLYQAWYRDPHVSACGFSFNTTNGVEIY